MAQEDISEQSESQLPSIPWREARMTLQELIISYSALGILILLWLGLHLFQQDGGYITNLYTEIISIVITVGILNVQAERRAKREREETLKAQLVRDASSVSNEIAKNAIHQMRHINEEWLTGENGLLKNAYLRNVAGADLSYANLNEIKLTDANLQNVDFTGANLKRANLAWASLQKSRFYETDMQDTSLLKADLQNTIFEYCNLDRADFHSADLKYSQIYYTSLKSVDFRVANLSHVIFLDVVLEDINFEHTNLEHANLQDCKIYRSNFSHANLQSVNLAFTDLHGVSLWDANLEGANLYRARLHNVLVHDAKFSTETILPDGTKWTPDTNLERFTNPEHPDFWELAWVKKRRKED